MSTPRDGHGSQSPRPFEQRTVLVISDSFHSLPDAVALLEESGHRVHYVHALERFQDLIGGDRDILGVADAVIAGRIMTIDESAFAAAPRLKVLALHTSGTDNVDLECASAAGVIVTNVKGVNADQCADLAMGLIIATTRQIVRGDHAIRAGNWAFDMAPSHDVSGATLGVIGLGGIGRALVRRSLGFDMKLLVNTRTPDRAFGVEHGAEYVSLNELLERSDIIALTASLNAQTRGMIGSDQFRRMKRTAFFVNVARGEMVDEVALAAALREGVIAGAGIDVFDPEPRFDSPLFGLDNAVLTPHLAGLTISGMVGAAKRSARNALTLLAGGTSDDVVNRGSLVIKGDRE